MDITHTKRIFTWIYFLKNIGYISHFKFIKKQQHLFLRVNLLYYNNRITGNFTKMLTKPSNKSNISYKSLFLISKCIGNAVLIISTSIGLLTHFDAIQKKIGGFLVCFFIL